MFQTTKQFLHVDHDFFLQNLGMGPQDLGMGHVGWASDFAEKKHQF